LTIVSKPQLIWTLQTANTSLNNQDETPFKPVVLEVESAVPSGSTKQF